MKHRLVRLVENDSTEYFCQHNRWLLTVWQLEDNRWTARIYRNGKMCRRAYGTCPLTAAVALNLRYPITIEL